jgi:hypothetical protein
MVESLTEIAKQILDVCPDCGKTTEDGFKVCHAKIEREKRGRRVVPYLEVEYSCECVKGGYSSDCYDMEQKEIEDHFKIRIINHPEEKQLLRTIRSLFNN